MSRSTLAVLALAVAAFLMGATFVVVKDAVAIMPPLPFIGWRFLAGAAAMLLLALPRGAAIWKDGAITGLVLFLGYAFQTEGLVRTSASNSGLITGLYVVFTPFLAAAAGRARLNRWTVAGAATALVGLTMLTVGDELRLQAGDLLTVGCAGAFAGHIVLLSRYASRHPVVPFTAVQILVTGVLAMAVSAVNGPVPLPTAEVLPAILGTALAVSAGAFLLQVWAQTVLGPARTAVVLALEPAFAALTAALVADERLTGRGWLGAGFILGGIYLVLGTAQESEEVQRAEAISAGH